jgi:hypothetical protein
MSDRSVVDETVDNDPVEDIVYDVCVLDRDEVETDEFSRAIIVALMLRRTRRRSEESMMMKAILGGSPFRVVLLVV